MYGISEIRKQNAQKKADDQNQKAARWTTLRHGGILVSAGGITKTLEKGRDDEDIAKFLKVTETKNSGKIRLAIEAIVGVKAPALA